MATLTIVHGYNARRNLGQRYSMLVRHHGNSATLPQQVCSQDLPPFSALPRQPSPVAAALSRGGSSTALEPPRRHRPRGALFESPALDVRG
eukprot:COSAG01_NODE_6059_length_3875_cov_286.205244_5_plen_91_part_00